VVSTHEVWSQKLTMRALRRSYVPAHRRPTLIVHRRIPGQWLERGRQPSLNGIIMRGLISASVRILAANLSAASLIPTSVHAQVTTQILPTLRYSVVGHGATPAWTS
jgi:hypothetical protein